MTMLYMRQEVKLVYGKISGPHFFVDFSTHMFQSVEKYLDVVGAWLIVRLKTDDSYFSFLSSEKILVIRTHPEELHVVKCATNTQISTHFGSQMRSINVD